MHTNPAQDMKLHTVPLHETIAKAASVLAPVWPLGNFIACNPLNGLESLPIEAAVAKAASLFQTPLVSAHAEAVNAAHIKWLLAYLDNGQATIAMPGRAAGFYAAWRRMAVHDRSITQGKSESVAWLRSLPANAQAVVETCLAKLNIPAAQQLAFLEGCFAALPGWGGYVAYRQNWQQTPSASSHPIDLTDYLAVRLAITCLLWPEAGRDMLQQNAAPNASVMLEAMATREQAYQQPLLQQLLQQVPAANAAAKPAEAQFVFCIDVRSEPLRRALESTGDYETFGFAGFFGLPVRVHDYHRDTQAESYPVLLSAQHDIHEEVSQDELACATHHQHKKDRARHLRAIYLALKDNMATTFALVETLGAWCGGWMVIRTLFPTLSVRLRSQLQRQFTPELLTEFQIDQCAEGISGISASDQIRYAEGALRMMGMTKNFAPIVMFCGHGSHTENNPYASALDCGACGGNHGGANARILAAILNKPLVREALAARALPIPESTVFVAAQHNTTTDDVHVYPLSAPLDAPSATRFATMLLNLEKARLLIGEDRASGFPAHAQAAPAAASITRSHNWAETRPEWGLARNAAFIVGPRRWSANINLRGRSFLHSYEWNEDTNGSALETILTAPMVVAEWINTQYLFSTLEPIAYGSGSKITHNIAGKIGVIQGNASDLMHGLALQSIATSDTTMFHEPLRLSTIVYAPCSKIDPIIARQKVLQTLFGGGWVHLFAIDPADGMAYQLSRELKWQLAVPH